ncbi:MAG: hypothetical protein C5B52_02095 [Bacteroidetes bacterium]|nr:MAG: hypothetical protein C5B52_02095 [Bacteroidota bacterium]
MPVFSNDLSMNLEVRARLISRGSDKPLCGEEFTVKLFDKDFFDDDFLGESKIDENGFAKIIFNPIDLYRKEPLVDKALDFYFLVYENGNEIFRSQVMKDTDLSYFQGLKMGEGEIIDLGTFLI